MRIQWKCILLIIGLAYWLPSGSAVSQTKDTTVTPQVTNWPKATFEPVLTGPDSLLAKNRRVRMIVVADLDSTGKPSNPKVTWSTDRRFDALAVGYALQYRFEHAPMAVASKARSVTIPMVFMNPPIKAKLVIH
jgi:hypothetical protein